MSQRTIQSPGVEFKEIDLSLRVAVPTGNNVLIMGYTNQGPTDEVIQITSISEYESVFGKPFTAAERYAYHSVSQVVNSSANIFFSRLPYGENGGNIFANEKYSALVYPILPDDGTTNYQTLSSGGLSAQAIETAYLMKPYHLELTRDEYEVLINDGVDWANNFGIAVDYTQFSNIKYAGLVILNTSQSVINEDYEGYYIGISDNRNTDPASNFADIVSINSINDSVTGSSYITVPSQRLDFTLSAVSESEDSLSEVMENISPFDIGTSDFDDVLSIGVLKLRKTPFSKSEIALDYILSEGYSGSIDNARELQNESGGPNVSYFLEDQDESSNNVRIFVNTNLSQNFSLSAIGNPLPTKKIRTLDSSSASSVFAGLASGYTSDDFVNEAFPLGVYQESEAMDKTIGSIPDKIERVFDILENPFVFPLDITIEAGLGTIFCSTQELSGTYNELATWPSLSTLEETTDNVVGDNSTIVNYTTIFNKFNTFAENRRKDHMFIADPIRQIFIRGENSKVLSQTYTDDDGNRVAKTFSKFIYWPLRHQFQNVNSSYSTVATNWVKNFDSSSSKNVWLPSSGVLANLMSSANNFWDAPAGLTRGIINNVSDIAFYPKQKQMDQLYKISLNPVVFYPSDGFVMWGQKTFQRKPSAFDRINVRRAFLFLERATVDTVRFYVFEPNNLFTRTQVVNVLTPIFDQAVQAGGINDFRIICNETNNTSEVIEQNELVIDIYIKPTKIAEFILVNFHATRQDFNFSELEI